ncbi:MAG: hypothetical protein V9H69_01985 [Anaerolineae bacterium]
MTAAAPKITWPLPFWPQDPAPADPLWPNEHHPWSSPMVEACLQRFSQPGDLVLDPFASQATLARVANAKRRRLLLNNASPATLLGVLASAAPPAAAVVDHAFSRIADAPRRGQTLAHHLAALYETICPECAQSIAAESFIWDHSIGEPVEKQYRCPHCGSQGDAPADMGDVAQVAALEVRGAAYWGLLSRLVKPGDPLTSPARSLQDLYPSRALLVFSELLTAAEQRLSNGEEQRAARAMILHTMTAGLPAASLHVSQEQARWQLPRRFVEHNLWLAFEHAHRTLRGRAAGETARRERPLPLAADLTRLRGPEGEGRVLPLALTTPELVEQLTPGSVALDSERAAPLRSSLLRAQFPVDRLAVRARGCQPPAPRPQHRPVELGLVRPRHRGRAARPAPHPGPRWTIAAGLRRPLSPARPGCADRGRRGWLAPGGPGQRKLALSAHRPNPMAL